MLHLILCLLIWPLFPDILCLDPDKYNLTVGLIVLSSDHVTRKIINSAIQLANQELTPLNYRLKLKVEKIEENGSFYAIRKACNLLTNGLVAIISPIGSFPSRHVSSMCNKFHIPHIVTDSSFPELQDRYSMDVHVVPNYSQYTQVIYNYIMRVEKWNNMILIYSSENGILKFENFVNHFDSRMKLRQWINHDQKRNKKLMTQLSKSRNYHNFVVDIPHWQIMEFLIMASVHNLTQPQYSFVFTDFDARLVDIAAFKINNQVNITAFSFVNDSHIEHILNSASDIKKLFRKITDSELSSKRSDIINKFMTQPALMFDSVAVIAKGLVKLAKVRPLTVASLSCKENHTWSLGPSLVNAMTSANDLYGATGKITFNEKIQRTEVNVSILELTENGFITSGYWAEKRIILLPRVIQNSDSPLNISLPPPLRVTTKIEPPFVFYSDPGVSEDFDPDPSAWRGYCIDLLMLIGKDLGLKFSIHVVADNSYGMSLGNQTNPDGTEKWTGMIGEIITKKADLIVAPITITYEREKVVDFTTPFMSLGLSILFQKPRPEAPGLFSFLSPLSQTVWMYVIGAYVGVCFLLYIISRITPYEWLPSNPCDDKSTTKTQFQLLNSLWFAVGALMRQGCDQPPQASSTRIIAGAWWFFTLIIISTYTANLAAFLTVNLMILPIKSAEELANQTTIKYGTLKGGSSFAFFEKASIPTYKKMYSFMQQNPDVLMSNVKKGIERVIISNGKYAFLMESSWIDYYVQRFCSIMRVGDLLDSKGYGIAFPERSPLRNLMSESILKLQKDQVLEMLKHKWWNDMNITEPCSMAKAEIIPPLGVHRVGGAFILLGVGFVVAALIAIIEQHIRYRRGSLKGHMSFFNFCGGELKFAMRFKSSSKKLKTEAMMKLSDKCPSPLQNQLVFSGDRIDGGCFRDPDKFEEIESHSNSLENQV